MSNLRPARGAKRQPKRVGRGNSSGKGTTAGKGTKGQSARTGGRNKLKWIGMKRLVLSTPKLRGFRSRWEKTAAVSLDLVSEAYASGEAVSLATLKRKGLVTKDAPSAKLIGGLAPLKKKLTVARGVALTASARMQVEAAGGEVKQKAK